MFTLNVNVSHLDVGGVAQRTDQAALRLSKSQEPRILVLQRGTGVGGRPVTSITLSRIPGFKLHSQASDLGFHLIIVPDISGRPSSQSHP